MSLHARTSSKPNPRKIKRSNEDGTRTRTLGLDPFKRTSLPDVRPGWLRKAGHGISFLIFLFLFAMG